MLFDKKYLLSVCVAAVLSFSPVGNSAFAEDDLEDLLAMDIESLAKVEVSTASKKVENISEAPSVVSVITAEDIRRYGARDLSDVLNRATSIQAYGSSYYPDNIISIRAGAVQIQNNHTLFLINGRPFRDSLTAGTVANLLQGFPIDLIETIEIIRGPGSVLYGSSAFNGIVNIKTKSADKFENGMAKVSYGSFNTRWIDSALASSGEEWSFVSGLKMLRADGYQLDVFDGAGTFGSYKSGDVDFGLAFAGEYKDFTFNFLRADSKVHNLSPIATYPITKNGLPAYFMDLGYEFTPVEGWTVNSNLTYNDATFVSSSNGRVFKSHDILAELTGRGSLTETVDLLVGGTATNMESSQFNAPANTQWYSLYSQLEWQALDWLKFVGGVQANRPISGDWDLSPRAAVIANFDENWGTKLMYGEAFRSPNFVESSINSPGIIVGNPALKPETIRTAEAQVFYQAPLYQASLTAYHNNMESLITRVGFPINFFNSRSIVFKGVEFEGKANLTKEISMQGNVAWQTSRDNLGRNETTYSPNLMAKLGVSYDSPKGFTFGLYENYFGDPSQTRDFAPAVVERNPKPVAYHLLTFNASADVQELLADPTLPNATLTLFVDNILDESIRFPDLNGTTVNSVPVHSGRAVYGSVAVKF